MKITRFVQISLITFVILFSSAQHSFARPLNICTHLGFEPFVIKEGNSLAGIDIEIIVQTLKNLKQPADIKAYPWKRLLKAIETGTCDFGFSLFDTEDRREYADYLFTIPLHYSTFSIFVPKGKEFTFNRVSDFFGMKIAHNRGFSLTIGLEQAIADGHITRMVFDDVGDALNMLEKGRVDAVLDNDARFRYYLKKKKKFHKITSLNVPFLPHHPAFIVMSKKTTFKDASNMKRKIEKQLRKLHLNGTIMNITSRYLN